MKNIILILFISTLSSAQDTIKKSFTNYKKNNIHLSLLGESIIGGSINYERIFLKKNYYNIGAGLGLGLTFGKWNIEYTNPLYLAINIGKKKHWDLPCLWNKRNGTARPTIWDLRCIAVLVKPIRLPMIQNTKIS